jgi:radical SAM superfamily enzyme YgiQ (UPF0313 family)
MTRDFSVYLVNVGNDPGFVSAANDATFPALSVLALGTWLRSTLPDVQVVARDGQVTPLQIIRREIESLKPNVVALSVLATSYNNALSIAQTAKDCGAVTVFGNDQAAQLSTRILEHRSYVDFVIGSEYGERAFELLIRALRDGSPSISSIPDLTYRADGRVTGFEYDRDKKTLSILRSPHYRAPSRKGALDVFPVVDRTLYPPDHWQAYLRNYLRKYPNVHAGKDIGAVTTMNRARGCSRAPDPVKCKFCDMLLDISFSSPDMFWCEVIAGHNDIGATIFYETCDSLTSFPSFIDGVARAKPKDLGFEPQFIAYGQAIDVVRRPHIAPLLKEIGVYRLNMGLEAGSEITLKHMKGVHDSVETNYAALRALKESGIKVYGSFVLGSEVETRETLGDTVAWVKQILEEGLLVDVSAQPVAPLPGNVYGRKLVASGLIRDESLRSDAPWSIDQVSEVYINNFSGVSFQDTIIAQQQIREHAAVLGVASRSGTVTASQLAQAGSVTRAEELK